MLATLAVTLAMVGSLALTPVARRVARRIDLVSRPDGHRKLESHPIPLLGGVALLLGMALGIGLCCLVLTADGSRCTLSLALAGSAGILCLLGCCDDLHDINAGWKLLGQILATLPVVLAGHYVQRLVVFGYVVEMGWLGSFWTIGWLVLGINAMNLVDGMDGLASTVGIVIATVIAGIAAMHGLQEVMLLALVTAGALAGFLVYNLPPARIYLGDCGSLIVGFTLSLLALEVSHPAPATAQLAVVGGLLFLPLLDTALAITRRSLQGQSFMAADRGHVHHRLLDRGYDTWRVLGILGVICLAGAGIAWSVSSWGHELWGWLALAALLVTLVNRRLAGDEEWGLARTLFARAARRPATGQSDVLRIPPPSYADDPAAAREVAAAGRLAAELPTENKRPKVAA